MDMKMWEGDATKVPTEFDGIARQHLLGINEIYGTTTGLTAEQLYDKYFDDPAVINANGKSLREGFVQEAAHAVVNDRYGEVTTLITNPTVLKTFNDRFYAKQRILLGTGANSGLVAGQNSNKIVSQFGDVSLQSDVFFDRREAIAYNRAATSAKAPAVPTTGSIAAASADTKNKFGTAHDGSYWYVVTAKNQYGESAPLLISSTVQAVAATESLDLAFADGGGAYPATSYVVYRTDITATAYTTSKFYPIFEVSVAEFQAGFDGAAAYHVRDRNRFIAGCHSAIMLDPTAMIWEYIQLMPTSKVEFALTTLAKEFAVINYGSPVLYQPGKIARIVNIGNDITD